MVVLTGLKLQSNQTKGRLPHRLNSSSCTILSLFINWNNLKSSLDFRLEQFSQSFEIILHLYINFHYIEAGLSNTCCLKLVGR